MRRAIFFPLLFTILLLGLTGCVSAPVATQDLRDLLPEPTSTKTPLASLKPPTETVHAEATAAPAAEEEFELEQATLAVQETGIDPIQQYLNVILPLADEQGVDSFKVREPEKLTEQEVDELLQRAKDRLEILQGITAPIELESVHLGILNSFELHLSACEKAASGDTAGAVEAYIQSVEAMAGATAELVLIPGTETYLDQLHP